MRVNIIYGIANIGDAARLAIREELKAVGYEVVNDSTVRGIKSGIDQAVSSYASPEQLILTLSHGLEQKNPFTINDLLRYQKEVPNVKIILVVSEDMKGSELLKDMSDNGMYLAMYSRETSAKKICELIVTGRTVEEAKRYYGVSGVKNVSKQITIEGAVAHMTQPARNDKEYLERIRWVRSVLPSEDAFVACVQRLPDEIKEVLAQNKTYYQYVEDYVVTKAGSAGRSDEKGGSLLGRFKSKSAKSKEEKKERAEAEKMAAAERLEREADRKAELEKLEAEKAAERERREAEKKAERERKEAEKAAERERKEAERAEAQKRNEEIRAKQEEERELRKAEEERKRAEQRDLEAELEVLKKQQAEEKARQDALRQERIRIEAEEKAKAELEFKREEAERKRVEAEKKAAERAAAKAEKMSTAGAKTGLGRWGAGGGTVGRGSGREDVCVFSLRHGTGTSYVAASIANYLAKNRSGDVSVVMGDTEYLEEIVAPRINVLPWAREGEAFTNANYIIHDIGVYGDMSSDRRIALQRASLKILLCKADGRYMSKLASFVETNDTSDIIFLFNELPNEWEKRVYDVMDFTKNVYCIPTFFAMAPNAPVLKVYNEIFKRK